MAEGYLEAKQAAFCDVKMMTIIIKINQKFIEVKFAVNSLKSNLKSQYIQVQNGTNDAL